MPEDGEFEALVARFRSPASETRRAMRLPKLRLFGSGTPASRP
ncbi:MAG: hypothetical protein ACTHKM_02910 [Tsuneonella sp.]